MFSWKTIKNMLGSGSSYNPTTRRYKVPKQTPDNTIGGGGSYGSSYGSSYGNSYSSAPSTSSDQYAGLASWLRRRKKKSTSPIAVSGVRA